MNLEEDVAKWARIEAARRDTSVSRLLGELLKERMSTHNGSATEAAERLANFGQAPPAVLTRAQNQKPDQ